jgi:hypothetical protein
MAWENNLNIMFKFSMHVGMILFVEFCPWHWDYFKFSWHNRYFKKQIYLLVWTEYVLLNQLNVLISKFNILLTVHHSIQYSETNVMHFLFNLLTIKCLYMFEALLAHLQETLHKQHLVYCMGVMSGLELNSNPGTRSVSNAHNM